MKKEGKSAKVKLIVSDEAEPLVRLKPGMKVRVETVQFVGSDLENQLPKIGARLCSGGGTCVALIDIEEWVTNPLDIQ